MEQVILDVPWIYADHQVLAVREALVNLEGLHQLYVSSAWRQIMISYDPAQIELSSIKQALSDAGYPIDDQPAPLLVEASAIKRDPQWEGLGLRATKTIQADIEMSGEFRRY